MKVLLVDAFDSFSHIIYQYLLVAGVDVTVVRSGGLAPDEIAAAPQDAVVLGPGPGSPDRSGHVEIVAAVAGVKPILGICLGHQAIARAFGAEVLPATRPMHGKRSTVRHDGRGVFVDVPGDVVVTRYHSLAVAESTVPDSLDVSARAEDGTVMGVRHRSLPVEGVQFHPESVLTDHGERMIANFVRRVSS